MNVRKFWNEKWNKEKGKLFQNSKERNRNSTLRKTSTKGNLVVKLE